MAGIRALPSGPHANKKSALLGGPQLFNVQFADHTAQIATCRPSRHVAEYVDRARQVTLARICNRIAVVEGLELGELADMLFKKVA